MHANIGLCELFWRVQHVTFALNQEIIQSNCTFYNWQCLFWSLPKTPPQFWEMIKTHQWFQKFHWRKLSPWSEELLAAWIAFLDYVISSYSSLQDGLITSPLRLELCFRLHFNEIFETFCTSMWLPPSWPAQLCTQSPRTSSGSTLTFHFLCWLCNFREAHL